MTYTLWFVTAYLVHRTVAQSKDSSDFTSSHPTAPKICCNRYTRPVAEEEIQQPVRAVDNRLLLKTYKGDNDGEDASIYSYHPLPQQMDIVKCNTRQCVHR